MTTRGRCKGGKVHTKVRAGQSAIVQILDGHKSNFMLAVKGDLDLGISLLICWKLEAEP